MITRPGGLPGWWEPLLTRVATARTEDFSTIRPPASGGRASAVLVLLGEDRPGEPDLLVLRRAATMRTHAGQPAFPGGAADPGDRDAAATALREAQEEVGLDPASATVLTTLPPLYIPISRFVVTPVLAWWHSPHPVGPCQPAEVDLVARLSVAELVDPVNRVRVRHRSGWTGPGFQAGGMLVWGFTAGVISTLLDMAGWSVPWQPGRIMELPDAPVRSAPPAVPAAVSEPAASVPAVGSASATSVPAAVSERAASVPAVGIAPAASDPEAGSVSAASVPEAGSAAEATASAPNATDEVVS